MFKAHEHESLKTFGKTNT